MYIHATIGGFLAGLALVLVHVGWGWSRRGSVKLELQNAVKLVMSCISVFVSFIIGWEILHSAVNDAGKIAETLSGFVKDNPPYYFVVIMVGCISAIWIGVSTIFGIFVQLRKPAELKSEAAG